MFVDAIGGGVLPSSRAPSSWTPKTHTHTPAQLYAHATHPLAHPPLFLSPFPATSCSLFVPSAPSRAQHSHFLLLPSPQAYISSVVGRGEGVEEERCKARLQSPAWELSTWVNRGHAGRPCQSGLLHHDNGFDRARFLVARCLLLAKSCGDGREG